MHLFWNAIISPLLEAIKPEVILEIGCDQGKHTRKLLDFCRWQGAILHAVDPAPQFDVAGFRRIYAEAFIFHRSLSLEVIDTIGPVDAVLIDGDHNWYTVINELRMISDVCNRCKAPFPIMFIHDVAWPYSRRDLYYDPDTIPEAFRHPYAKKGMLPGRAKLLEGGGLNGHLYNAVWERTPRNGVLTAVEDFLDQDDHPFEFILLPGLNGLGILAPCELKAANPSLSSALQELVCGEPIRALIQEMEKARIHEQIEKINRQHRIGALSAAHRRQTANLEQAVAALEESLNAAHRHLEENQRQIDAYQKQVSWQEERLSTLQGLFEATERAAVGLLSSFRWKLGNALGDCLRFVFRRLQPALAPQVIQQSGEAYRQWRSQAAPEAIPPANFFSKTDKEGQGRSVQAQNALHLMRLQAREVHYAFRQRPQTKKVSIILAVAGGEKDIPRAVRSIQCQHYRNFDVIVVDAGSGRSPEKELKSGSSDFDVHWMPSDEGDDLGPLSKGLMYADGDYVCYLRSGIEWQPEFLAIMINLLEDLPALSMVYCAREICTDRGAADICYPVFNPSWMLNRPIITLDSVVHRRKLIAQYGGFDSRLKKLADWDLLLRYTQDAHPLSTALPLIRDHGNDHGNSRSQTLIDAAGNRKHAFEVDCIQRKWLSNRLEFDGMIRGSRLPHALFSPAQPCQEHLEDIQASIIIPSYEALDCLKLCVHAIEAFTPAPNYELIIVDNASSKAVVDYLKELEASHDRLTLMLNEKNMGFSYAVNQGLAAAQAGNDVVLMNNDAIVTQGWLNAFAAVRHDLPEAGIIAPQQVLLPKTHTMRTHVPGCCPDREVDVTLSAHHNNLAKPCPLDWRRGYMLLRWATFFCVYISRECLAQNGMLNHKDGRHYRSDKTYCQQVNQDGRFQIVYTPHAKVYHLLQQATKALKEKDPEGYEMMFEKNSWGSLDVPGLPEMGAKQEVDHG